MLLLFRTVFSTKNTTTPHFVCSIYEGTLHSRGSSSCNRWYFTFDGAECTKPATIEGIVWVPSTTVNPYRHRNIVTRFLKVTYAWASG